MKCDVDHVPKCTRLSLSLVPGHNYAQEKLRLVTLDMKFGPEVVETEVNVWSHYVFIIYVCICHAVCCAAMHCLFCEADVTACPRQAVSFLKTEEAGRACVSC